MGNHKYKEIRKRGRFNAPDHPVSRLVVDDDVLVCQILSRLPVKSLMRFKCVSKAWKSMIEQDSFFINLHLTHSQARPGLFSFLPTSFAGEDDQTRDYEYLILADLSFNGKPAAKIHTTRKTKSFPHCKILGPVNGLVCFVKHCAVRIYNVSTREATPWIKSRVCVREEKRNVALLRIDEPWCYFGFDPTARKHKALFVWCEGKFEDFPVCEVLTVGDNTWRTINEVPPCVPSMLHTCANGSIYWYLYNLHLDRVGEEIIQYCNESIMAFDIGSEKFRVIPVPEFTISNVEYGGIHVLEVDGCLAILRWSGALPWADAIVKVWKFHDHNNAYGISSTGRDNWTQEKSMALPSYMLNGMHFIHSVAGKDQLILEIYREDGSETRLSRDRNVKFSEFYSYNRDENTLGEFKIDGICDIPVGWTSDNTVCTTFVESLLRVR